MPSIAGFTEDKAPQRMWKYSCPPVVIAPYRPRSAQDCLRTLERPVMESEIGRQALALRGWRRWLAQAAGLPIPDIRSTPA